MSTKPSFSSLVAQSLQEHLQKKQPAPSVVENTIKMSAEEKKQAAQEEKERIKMLTKKMQAYSMLGDTQKLQEVIAQGAQALSSFRQNNSNPLILAVAAEQPQVVEYFVRSFGVQALGPSHVFSNILHECLKKDDTVSLKVICEATTLAGTKIPSPPYHNDTGQWCALAMQMNAHKSCAYLLDSGHLKTDLSLVIKERSRTLFPTALLRALEVSDFPAAQTIWTHITKAYAKNNVSLLFPEKNPQARQFISFLTRNLNATGFLFLAHLAPDLFEHWDKNQKYQQHGNVDIPIAFRTILHIPPQEMDIAKYLQDKGVSKNWRISKDTRKKPLSIDTAFKQKTAGTPEDAFGLFEFLILEQKGSVLKDLVQYEPFRSNFMQKMSNYQKGAPGWEILLLCAKERNLKEACDPFVQWNDLPLPQGITLTHFAFCEDISGRQLFWTDLLKKEFQNPPYQRQSTLHFARGFFENNKEFMYGKDAQTFSKFLAQCEKTFLAKSIGRVAKSKSALGRRL